MAPSLVGADNRSTARIVLLLLAIAALMYYSCYRRRRCKVPKPLCRSRNALLYTPHPASLEVLCAPAEALVDADRHEQHVSFDGFENMRRAAWQLAGLVEAISPDLVFFFATGGFPFALPALHVLATHLHRADLANNRRWHVFPGLAWEGEIDHTPYPEFFEAECGSLVEEALSRTNRLTILAFDTTNVGNATRNAVIHIQQAVAKVPAASADRVMVHVVGLVNGTRTHSEAKGDQTQPIAFADGSQQIGRAHV